MKLAAPPPKVPSSTPWRLRISVTVEAAGAASPRRFRTAAILRPPQAGCSPRTASTAASISAGALLGEDNGRRDRSSSPSIPSACQRASNR